MDAREDFIRLLLSTEDEVRGLICALVSDPHQRDDIFQETALVMWRNFDSLRNREAFAAWARGIASNVVLQQRARKRATVALSDDALQSVRQAFDRTEELRQDRRVALADCIGALPQRSREMLTLRYDEGLKGTEIAERLGMTLDAVHKTFSRLRGALEECVRRKLGQRRSDAL